MENRYTIIDDKQSYMFQKGCPVHCIHTRILKDNKSKNTLAQIKFINTSKSVSSIYIEITCYDPANNCLGNISNVVYTNVNAARNATFGDRQPINIRNNTANIKLKINKIIFLDGEIWENQCDTELKIINDFKTTSSLEDLEEIYIEELTKNGIKANFLFCETDDYWICPCGAVNETDSCYKCGATKELNQKLLNLDFLNKEKETLVAKKAELVTIKERKNKITLIVLICCVFVIIVVLAIRSNLAQKNKYQYALDCYNNKDYYAAMNNFSELDDYKDSEEFYKKSSQVYNAMTIYDSGDINGTIDYIHNEKLDFSEGTQLLHWCYYKLGDEYYQKALKNSDSFYYNKAIENFSLLNDYADSKIRIADAYMHMNNYKTALEVLNSIKDKEYYKDYTGEISSKIIDCNNGILYVDAINLINSGKITEGIEKLKTVDTDFIDTKEMLDKWSIAQSKGLIGKWKGDNDFVKGIFVGLMCEDNDICYNIKIYYTNYTKQYIKSIDNSLKIDLGYGTDITEDYNNAIIPTSYFNNSETDKNIINTAIAGNGKLIGDSNNSKEEIYYDYYLSKENNNLILTINGHTLFGGEIKSSEQFKFTKVL